MGLNYTYILIINQMELLSLFTLFFQKTSRSKNMSATFHVQHFDMFLYVSVNIEMI